jgi:hypothetical protein
MHPTGPVKGALLPLVARVLLCMGHVVMCRAACVASGAVAVAVTCVGPTTAVRI